VLLPLKHLATARSRLAATRLTEAERRQLAPLLATGERILEHRVRDRFRPILLEAVQRSGLPENGVVTTVARDKLVEELLDRIVARGFFHFSELRDAISRNQAKLGDLAGPAADPGDPLLRIDKALAAPWRVCTAAARSTSASCSASARSSSAPSWAGLHPLPRPALPRCLRHSGGTPAPRGHRRQGHCRDPRQHRCWYYILGLALFLVPLVNSEPFRRVIGTH